MKKENLTISPETQAIIECMDSLNNNCEQTHLALRKTYSDQVTCELMNEKYNPAFNELKGVLQAFLLQSIEHHMGCINFKEI